MGRGQKRDVLFYRRLLERKSAELRALATRLPDSAFALRRDAKNCEKASRSPRLSVEQLRRNFEGRWATAATWGGSKRKERLSSPSRDAGVSYSGNPTNPTSGLAAPGRMLGSLCRFCAGTGAEASRLGSGP